MLNQMITRQSYQLSFNDVFHLLGWLFLAVIVVIWLVRPPFAPKAGTPIGGH
jgi:DHA2 family multidrug resistance protein